MSAFFNRVKFTSSTAGTAAFGVGTEVTGFRTPATAGVADGTPVSYTAESSARVQWETGHGTYNSAGPTISRTTVLENSSGTTSAINFGAAPTVWLDFLAQDVGRSVLTADRTYYVRTTGGDSNTGLTSGTAWLTLQHAVDVIAGTIDKAGFTVTISIGAGTFAGVGLKSGVGGGNVYFSGAGVGSTIIDNGPADGTFNYGECFSSTVPIEYAVYFHNFTTHPAAPFTIHFGFYSPIEVLFGTPAGAAADLAHIFDFSVMDLSSPAAEVSVFYGSTIALSTPAGSAYNYVQVDTGGFLVINPSTITLTGTPNFSIAFVRVEDEGELRSAATFSGSAIGARFIVDSCGTINVIGSGLNYFPGNAAGTISDGGTYIG